MMCGIYGSLALVGDAPSKPADEMGQLLRHRGPHSLRSIARGRAHLGCARLRIVDLSPEADGPLTSPCGRFTLTCNGEIYNAPELRQRYRDYPFRTGSDLEVVFPAYLEGGTAALEQLVGMYALALWDANEERLILMRDRAGEKPLFLRRDGEDLTFASEIHPLLSERASSRELSRDAVLDYLQLGYVRGPRTIFRHVEQIPAGTIVSFGPDGETSTTYWPPRETTRHHRDRATSGELLRLLRASVRTQATADVPRGIYLSGGLDSSLLAALLREFLPSEELTAFTVRFGASSYDEGDWADYVADRLRIPTRQITLGEEDLIAVWRRVVDSVADPISDPAILPTVALGELASQSVRVVFSGEGADELFGGYPTYLGHRLADAYLRSPAPFRRLAEKAVSLQRVSHDKVPLSFLARRFLQEAGLPLVDRHLRWFGPGGDRLSSLSRPLHEAVADLVPPGGFQSVSELMRLDYGSYLRDNLLVKLDRATMLSGVESRAPFLDPEITRFAWRLDEAQLTRGLKTKVLLKRTARQVLPRKVVERRKRGFSLPMASWINGSLAGEVDRLLEPSRLHEQGIFDVDRTRHALEAHRAAREDNSRQLWNLVHFQAWLDRWAPGTTKDALR